MDVEILNTSHVPVYGYGKSHGYTKLVRLFTLPLPLAAYDAYLYASSILVEENEYYKNVLKDIVDEMKLGRKLVPPSEEGLGKIVQLILRWHCRLSHVLAHTAMITLQLEDIITDPTDTLSSILSFIWREDWEWEGRGGKHHQGTPQSGGWKREAEDIITKDGDHGNISSAGSDESENGNNNAFKKSIQGAFASEMQRSQDITSWPCPSFWEGVDSSSSSTTKTLADYGEDGNHQLMRVLQQISGEMVPDCKEDDPFIRCTVNKDKCEVKRDAKC